MYKILIKLTIKDYNNTSNPEVRSRYGIFCGAFGIITNLFISLIKIIAGLISGSIAIIADGINSLMDGASSVITLIAFKLSSAPADKEHPFGHERLEYISGLIVSIVILLVGAFLAESSIKKIINPEEINKSNLYLIIGILVISILIKVWQAMVYKKAGKAIESKALLASSFDSLSDILSTFAVLVSLLISQFISYNLDGIFGLGVSIFIIVSGIKLIKETISPLLGEAPNEEIIKKITNKLTSYDGVLGYHDLVIHSYGASKVFVTVHLEVDAAVDVRKSHDLIDKIEQDFRITDNINLLIHLDPVDLQDEPMMILKEEVKLIIQNIDNELSFHDFRVVKTKNSKKIMFDLVVPPQYKMSDDEIDEKIKTEIKKINPQLNLMITYDHNYFE